MEPLTTQANLFAQQKRQNPVTKCSMCDATYRHFSLTCSAVCKLARKEMIAARRKDRLTDEKVNQVWERMKDPEYYQYKPQIGSGSRWMSESVNVPMIAW